MGSCGIESVPYYYPPNVTSAGAGGVVSATSLTFYHNTSNNTSDFKGYELYYRCYADSSKAEYDRQSIEALAASSSAAPDSVLYSMVNTYKFNRMYDSSTSSGNTPLLWFSNPAYNQSSITYVVSIPSTSDWTVHATYGYDGSSLTTNLYRAAYASSGIYTHKYFSNPPALTNLADFTASNPTDNDYDGNTYSSASSGTISSSGDNPYNSGAFSAPLYMVVFAVGIGLPQDSLNTVPSLPASFGATIKIR